MMNIIKIINIMLYFQDQSSEEKADILREKRKQIWRFNKCIALISKSEQKGLDLKM